MIQSLVCVIALMANRLVLGLDIGVGVMEKRTCSERPVVGGVCFKSPRTLTRIHPNKVGEEVNIQIDGRTMKRITRAIHPPIFEIPNFLNETETNHILSKATERGLQASGIYGDPKLMDDEINSGKDLRHVVRVSTQAFVEYTTPILENLREKVMQLTGLSRMAVFNSEHLQIVHYKPGGHYHVHWDSLDSVPGPNGLSHAPLPCCHLHVTDCPIRTIDCCRICRYLTILYYLNDVESGGETAFPWAQFENDGKPPDMHFKDESLNLSFMCHSANLVVKPKKGTAILWYSHFLDENNCMSRMDPAALHGGCDILKGEKWIANTWINAPVEGESCP